MKPQISVVMPVYNPGEHLISAVASILEQSLADWELICVNDGSTDNSPAVLDWFAGQDDRIRIVHQSNSGIVKALNNGCQLARSPFICRMDADDIAVANRLQLQAKYMLEHPDCVALGGAILEIDSDGDRLRAGTLPQNHDDIVANLLHRRSGLYHPTTMIRRSAFEAVEGYRAEYQWIEDHDLWLRISQRGTLANTHDIVLLYRQHTLSVCWSRSLQQRELMNKLMEETYRRLGLDLPDEIILSAVEQRAPAGPGKWARAAAKGGYVRSTIKHLNKLTSVAPVGYASRMVMECMLRLPIGFCRRCLQRNRVPTSSFSNWHNRIRAAGIIGQSNSKSSPQPIRAA